MRAYRVLLKNVIPRSSPNELDGIFVNGDTYHLIDTKYVYVTAEDPRWIYEFFGEKNISTIEDLGSGFALVEPYIPNERKFKEWMVVT